MTDYLELARQQSERFWSKVDRSGDCWLWTCGKDKDGYGKFAVTMPSGTGPKQKHVRAHRLAYEMEHGSVPAGLVMLHHCDNPACVRPSHMRPGTQTDNRADCTRKGRNATGDRNGTRTHPESRPRGDRHHAKSRPWTMRRGSNHPGATLTDSVVVDIRARRREGVSVREIADSLGVSKSTIASALSGRTWRHVAASSAEVDPRQVPLFGKTGT